MEQASMNIIPTQISAPRQLPEETRNLRPEQKAAIILVTMGPEFAAPVFDKLSDIHVKSFVNALESLHQVSQEAVLGVVAEFLTRLGKYRMGLNIGPKKAYKMAQDYIQTDRAKRIFGEAVEIEDSFDTASFWDEFAAKPAKELAQYLAKQRIDVAVFLLSELDDGVAGDVLSEVDDDLAVTYATYLSSGVEVPEPTRRAIMEMVRLDFARSDGTETGSVAIEFVANLLSVVSKTRRDIVLSGIEKVDPERAKKIRDGMLTFEDIPTRLPPTAVMVIFKECEKDAMMRALKAGGGEAPDSVEFLLGNISQRLAGQFKEEVEEMDDLKGKIADKALSHLMGLISKLDRDGRISLIKKTDLEEGEDAA